MTQVPCMLLVAALAAMSAVASARPRLLALPLSDLRLVRAVRGAPLRGVPYLPAGPTGSPPPPPGSPGFSPGSPPPAPQYKPSYEHNDRSYRKRPSRGQRQAFEEPRFEPEPEESRTRFGRQSGGGGGGGDHHDFVDYGAHTGHHGAFGWYADFPVHKGS